METDNQILTISEFCKATRLCRTYAYALLKKGELKAIKIGRRTLIRREDMGEWIASLANYPSTLSQDGGNNDQ